MPNGKLETIAEIKRILAEVRGPPKAPEEEIPGVTKIALQRLRRLKTPQVYTAELAREMGVEIDPDWLLKISPGRDGEEPTFGFISPERVEVPVEDIREFTEGPQKGRWVTRERLEALEAERVEAYEAERFEIEQAFGAVFPELDVWEVLPEISVSELMPVPERMRAEEAQVAFFESIYTIGRTPQTERLLKVLMPELTEEDLAGFFGVEVPSVRQALLKVFPSYEYNLDEFVDWAIENEEAFRGKIEEIGRTEDTTALLKAVYPRMTDEQIDEFFAEPIKPVSNKFLDAIQTGLQYVEGWWKTGLMEAGFALYKGLEIVFREENSWTSQAETIMDSAYKKHGWKAIFSDEVNEAWDIYFQERDVRGPAKIVAEFANPIWWAGAGGLAGLLARPFTKIPVLGKTLQGAAKAVQATEEVALLPLTAPLKGGIRQVGKAFGVKPSRPFLADVLPTATELKTWMFKSDTFRKVAQHIPGMKWLAPGTVISEKLPATLITKPEIEGAVVQEILQRNAILELGQGTKGQALAYLRELGTTRGILGVRNGICNARLVKPQFAGESLALGDVVQAPERYIFKHKAGFEYCKRAQQICREMYELAAKEGIEVHKVGLEPFEEYVHWVCVGKIGKDGVLQMGRRGTRGVGGIVPSMKTRRFESMMDGIKAGYKYSDDLEVYVATYVDDMFRAIGDKRLGDGLAEVIPKVEGMLPTKPLDRLIALYPQREIAWTGIRKEMADLGYALSGVGRATRGEQLSEATLKAIERRLPEAGARLRKAIRITPLEFEQGIKGISEAIWADIKATRAGFRKALQTVRAKRLEISPEARRQAEEAVHLEEELAGLQEWITTEPAAALRSLIKTTGWYKGEVKNLTLKQYRDLTGKREILPNILTPDKKHVRWEYALDDIATEKGYASGEALKEGIEQAGKSLERIAELKHEIPRLEPAIIKAKPIGEKDVLPGELTETLNMLNVESGKQIRFLDLLYRQSYKETMAARLASLRVLSKELKTKLEALKPSWWKARFERSEAMEIVSKPILGREEGFIRTATGYAHPMFQNQIYPRAIADQATKLLNEEAAWFFRKTAGISAAFRMAIAVLDISAWCIQGLITQFAHPIRAGRANIAMIEALIKPKIFQQYLVKIAPSMNERLYYLGAQRPFEFFESMGWFVKMAGKVPGGKAVIGQTYGRAQASFSMWATVYKDLMWQANSKHWIKAGQGAEFARYLDRMTGMMSFNQLGMPANMKAFLAGWVSFAPQYRFAVISWFSYLFKGGMIGAEARKDLAKMVAGALISYTAFCKVTDNPVYLDPYKDGKKFLSINVDGHWIGIGAAVVSMVRAFVDITASALSIEENEPMDFLTLDKWQNPLIRFWFMQSAVLPTMIEEIATRRDFLGYPLESAEDWAMWAGEQVTPIWLQDIFFDKSGVPVSPLSVLGNFAGLRTSPQTRWETLNDKLMALGAWEVVTDLTDEQRAKIEAGETVLSVLDKYQKAEMFNAFPELVELYEEGIADALNRSSQIRKNYETATTSVREEAVDSLTRAMDVGVKLEGEDTRWLRDSYGSIMNTYGAKNDILRGVEDWQDMFDEWDEAREKRKPEAELVDLAYWEFIEDVVSPDRELPETGFDFEAYDQALTDFKDKWGEEIYGKILYVLENNKADFPDWAIKLWKDRIKLNEGGYWKLLPKSIISMTEELWDMSNRKAKYPGFYALWQQYEALKTDTERKAFLERHPHAEVDFRGVWRQARPEEDAMLALWGYGGKLQTREAYDLLVKWGEELGIPLEQMGLGLPPRTLIKDYFEHAAIVRETSGSSIEARLYKLEHPEWLDWGVENWGWGDLSDESLDILKLRVDFKEQFTQYEAYGDIKSDLYEEDDKTRAEKRQAFLELEANAIFRDAYYRTKAYDDGYAEENWDPYVEYSKLPEWGDWRERFLLQPENKGFYEEWISEDIGEGHLRITEKKVSLVKRDEIYQQFIEKFKDYDDVAGLTEDQAKRKRAKLLADTDFADAYYRVKAYDVGFPERRHDDYVEWFANPPKKADDPWFMKPENKKETFYGDDWWLMEHSEFHEAMVQLYKDTDGKKGWEKPRDFSKVPTKAVFELYKTYKGLPAGMPRFDFRKQHPELDAWGVLAFEWKPIAERGKKKAKKTPWEIQQEVERFKEMFGSPGSEEFGQSEESAEEGMNPAGWREEYAEGTPHWATDMEPSVFAKEFVGTMKSNKAESVLEIGCGNGRDSIQFAKSGFTVTSVDLTPKAVELAKKNAQKAKTDINFKVANAEKLPFGEGEFDSVFTLSVLHSTELEKSLPELYRVLKPGGVAFVHIYADTQFKSGKEPEGIINYDDYLADIKDLGFKILKSYKEQEDKFDELGEKHSIFVVSLKKAG